MKILRVDVLPTSRSLNSLRLRLPVPEPAPEPGLLPFTVVGAWTGDGMDEGVWENSFIYHVMAKDPLEASRIARTQAAEQRVWPAGDEPTPEEIREQFRQAEVVSVFPGHLKDAFIQEDFKKTQHDLAEAMVPKGTDMEALITELERLMPDHEFAITEVQLPLEYANIPAEIWEQSIQNVRAAQESAA